MPVELGIAWCNDSIALRISVQLLIARKVLLREPIQQHRARVAGKVLPIPY